MDRVELGDRLCQWHSSMYDPIYAVGSFYVDNQVYPKKEIVEDAVSNLSGDLSEFQRMLDGEQVMVQRYGKQVDLKVFAGYTSEVLTAHVADLEEIVSELESFMAEDYEEAA